MNNLMNDLRVDLFRKQAVVLEWMQDLGFNYKFIAVEDSNEVHVEFSFGSYKKFIMNFEDFMIDQLELQFDFDVETTVEILKEILIEVFNLDDSPYETVCKVIEQQFEKHILAPNELIDDINITCSDFNVEVVVINDKGDRRLYIADYDEWLNYSNAEKIAWQITEQMIEMGNGIKL